jgi:hypothetical protein
MLSLSDADVASLATKQRFLTYDTLTHNERERERENEALVHSALLNVVVGCRLLCILMAIASICMYGTEQFANNTYISENALLLGQARPLFASNSRSRNHLDLAVIKTNNFHELAHATSVLPVLVLVLVYLTYSL